MTKKEALEYLKKIKDTEPVFILRGQDQSAPDIVRYWAGQNRDHLTATKMGNAEDIARAMELYGPRKQAD